MNRLQRRRLLWIAALALASAPFAFAPHAWVTPAPRASTRLLGPLLPIVASAQWVRVDAAMRAGRPELALARAQTLFDLEPRSPDARVFVSTYLAFNVASPERELDPSRRAAWLRAAVDLLRAGEATVDAPGELALWAGQLLARAAETDPKAGGAAGARGLWSEAADCYQRAAELGHPRAAERVRNAREHANASE